MSSGDVLVSTIANVTIDSNRSAQESRERSKRIAQENLEENRDLLDSALIKTECADWVTLTLNRKVYSNVPWMVVSAIPAERTGQDRTVLVLNSSTSQLADDLARKRPGLEAYKARAQRSCQLKIDAMLTELKSFVQSHSQP